MKNYYTFRHTYEPAEWSQTSPTTVEVSIDTVSKGELLEAFTQFLRGCGFSIGQLVEEEDGS